MEISKLLVGHTFHGNTDELSGITQNYLIDKTDNSFFAVEMKIGGRHEIHEFSNLQSALGYSRHHNTVYKFIEYTDSEAQRRILVVHNIIFSDKIVAFHNFYGIGDDWKLYVNSKDDIVVQHIKFPKTDITLKFRNFPTGSEFYLHLSCLIYVLRNYKLETVKEIKSTLQKVIDSVT